ncbi:hypothetical protein BASA81_007870 [Batrachochytrium salamandrivorans]|nr:hypothetical protein BASA81_007870 [Batrachochytrium salamandrivorans]
MPETQLGQIAVGVLQYGTKWSSTLPAMSSYHNLNSFTSLLGGLQREGDQLKEASLKLPSSPSLDSTDLHAGRSQSLIGKVAIIKAQLVQPLALKWTAKAPPVDSHQHLSQSKPQFSHVTVSQERQSKPPTNVQAYNTSLVMTWKG